MIISIKDKLQKKNMSRYELAKRVGVTYPTITSIYNEESVSIKFEVLEKICAELECTPNEILVAEDPALIRLMTCHYKLNKIHSNEKDDTE